MLSPSASLPILAKTIIAEHLVKINLCFFVQVVNKPSPHSVTVLEVKGYVFSDFTISEGFSSVCPVLTSFAFFVHYPAPYFQFTCKI